MSVWNFSGGESDFRTHEHPEVVLSLTSDDSTGALQGTLYWKIMGVTWQVQGGWAASGSLPDRSYSVFSLSGSDGGAPTTFVAAIGMVEGPGDYPSQIDIQFQAISSGDGGIQQWSGPMKPM